MRSVLCLSLLAATFVTTQAADWPRFRGPDLNGASRETGWSSTWSADGPKVAWRAKVGLGFSSVVVSGGKVIATGHDGHAKGQDTLVCLDAATGKELWKHSYAAPLGNKYFEGGTTGSVAAGADAGATGAMILAGGGAVTPGAVVDGGVWLMASDGATRATARILPPTKHRQPRPLVTDRIEFPHKASRALAVVAS